MDRRGFGKSLMDVRLGQQIWKSNKSTVVEVGSPPGSSKRQHSNVPRFESSNFCRHYCRPVCSLRRCRSASPRLCHGSDHSGSDDDESLACGVDATITRLQKIDKRIEEQTDNGEEDDDDSESVIVLEEPNRLFIPKSPSCTPPDCIPEDEGVKVESTSPSKCDCLTIENVAKHNKFLTSRTSRNSSLCGPSDEEELESFHSIINETVTPSKTSLQEFSFGGASTAGMNGISHCLSPVTPNRSTCSSTNDGTSGIDLPICSSTKNQTLSKLGNGAEMFYLSTSPSSGLSDEVSPVLNRRRTTSCKDGGINVRHNKSPHKEVKVSVQAHGLQIVMPNLSSAGTSSNSRRSSVEVEECVSQANNVIGAVEGEPVVRNLKTPTKLYSRRPSSLSVGSLYPVSPGNQSSSSSPVKPNSVSTMEKVMFLHLMNEIQSLPEQDVTTEQASRRFSTDRSRQSSISREEDDLMKDIQPLQADETLVGGIDAENPEICVDACPSDGESEGLDDTLSNTEAEVIAEGFGLQITRADLATLSGTSWLNDKIVNFYLKLVTERGRLNKEPEVYAYDTFFFPKLIKCGYDSVKKWTKIDVFKHDILIIPVHLGTHWCMAAVDFRKQTLVYYDSMGGENESCLATIWDYLYQESVRRSVEPLNEEVWEIGCAKGIPMQSNNSDCGVFMCKYAECITRDAELDFSQNDMPEIRREMTEEIKSMKLLHHRS